MSTRKIATALGAAVLLLGAPASYALAGEHGNGGGKDKVKQCDDGIDNDGDGTIDGADAGCGSENDNSEADEPAEEPGGGTPPALEVPAELQAVIDEVTAALTPEEPCEGADCPPAEEPPAEEPAPDPAAEIANLVDEVVGQLPPAEAPAVPELPAPGAPELPALPAPELPSFPELPPPPA